MTRLLARRWRRWLFWSHLGAGVLAALLILFFSVTGGLLAFERPLTAHADRAYRVQPPIAGIPFQAMRMPLDALIAKAPAPLQQITVYADPAMPVALQAGRAVVYYADPYTGTVTGPASPRTRAFFTEVWSLHRWFGLQEHHRKAAAFVKGVSNSIFVYLILSGIAVWWPARITPFELRTRLQPRFRAKPRALLGNWHRVAGAWLALPLLVITMTGQVMAYPWLNAALFRLAGTPLPAGSEHRPQNGFALRSGFGPEHNTHGAGATANLQAGLLAAEGAVSAWQSANLRLPQHGQQLQFSMDRGTGGHPDQQTQVTVAQGHVQAIGFAAQPRGRRWRAWVRFSHTGEAGGVWGEAAAVLTCMGAAVLSLTGLLLAGWRVRHRRLSAASAGVPAHQPTA